MKKEVIFLFVILILASSIAIAQENGAQPSPTSAEGIAEGSENAGSSGDADDRLESGISESESNEGENLGGEIESELDDEEEFEGNVDEELGDAGIAPDSAFYFVDEFFDRFGSCIDNRKEKVAEIREMVKAGKIEDAKEALEKYELCADEVEKEVSPEEKEAAQRSARVIRKTVREIRDDIPKDERERFEDIIDKENKIETAAEIASKIKDLCEQLAKIDLGEYERVCRVKGDAPRWQRELDDELTDDQRNAARRFASVMSQCFRTEGRECNCNELEDINKPFADRCAIVAPLAAQCEEGEESACEAMDDATEGIEDLLPEYLLDVFQELEEDVSRDQFEFHMPRECREKGARNPRECMKVMFELNAPDECKEAFERGEIDFSNEREAREACERIMFEENAPEECIEAGLRNPRECGAFMFKENAPKECIEAGLTGDHRDDPRKCEKLMRELGGDREGPNRGPGRPRDFAVAAGYRCREIQNSEERLRCFDEALNNAGERGRGEGEDHGGWPPPCQEAQAFTRESCESVMKTWGEKQREGYQAYYERDNFNRYAETFEKERACVQRCSSEGKAWSFANGQCVCSESPDRDRFRPSQEGEFREGFNEPRSCGDCSQNKCADGTTSTCNSANGFCECPQAQQQQPSSEIPVEPQPSPSSETTTTTTDSGGSTGTSETGTSSGSSGGGESESTSGTSGTTGSVIAIDSRFFDYYYWG